MVASLRSNQPLGEPAFAHSMASTQLVIQEPSGSCRGTTTPEQSGRASRGVCSSIRGGIGYHSGPHTSLHIRSASANRVNSACSWVQARVT